MQPAIPTARESNPDATARPRLSPWKLLLVLPYLGLCFPSVYARATPALWGFPFFYWYQLAWVVPTSAILGVSYLRASRSKKVR